MALLTIGTLATTTLQGFQWSSDPNAVSNTDFAAVANGITQDRGAQGNKPGNIIPGALTRSGILEIPDRMMIKMSRNGDWVATDLFGTVFYIPQRALPKTLTNANCTTVSGSPTVTLGSSTCQALGWQVGTHVTGTNIPANSVIGTIGVGGLTFTLANTSGASVNATGSASNTTITAGTFTHS